MVSAAKFIRGLEGNMRLRVNNKPIPDYARGFKNPVPKPPNGGNGYIIPVVKFIAKGFKYAPLMLLYDLVFPKPVSDGTLPSWVKDVGQQEPIGEPILNATGVAGKQYDLRYRTYAGGTAVPKEGITSLGTNVYAPYQLKFTFTANIAGLSTEGFPKLSAKAPTGSQGGDFFLEVIGRTQSGLEQATFKTNRLGTTSFGLQGYIEFLGLVGGVNAPVPPPSQDLSPPTRDPKQVLIDQINAEDWKFSGFTELPTIKPGKITKIPDFFKLLDKENQLNEDEFELPKLTKKPAVIPTEIPQPLPDAESIPEVDLLPDPPPINLPPPSLEPTAPKPTKKWAKTTIYLDKNGLLPKINPDPQPDVNPLPDLVPEPNKKWTKITKYQPDPQPKSGSVPPAIINYPPPVKTTDKTENDDPKPSGNGIIIPPPPPIQTGVDDCAGSCSTKALAKGSPGLLNIAGLLNDAAIQNPLLKKIDETTTVTKNTITSPEFGLKKIQDFADTAWKATHADKVINVITAMTVLHNAAMLSQNIGQSLAEAANAGLSLFNVKNAQQQPIDVGQAIGGTIKAKIMQVIGASTFNTLAETWLKLNRIHQAVGATVSAIHGTKNALLEADEITGGNVAKIGNALQDQGVIEDDTYKWMNDKPDYKENFKGLLGRLEQVEDVTQRASSIVSAGLEIKETSTELISSSTELEKVTKEFVDDYQLKRNNDTATSQSPAVERLDLLKKEDE